jgi:aryl-alcohol dehydrogenase (NADP+)
MGDKPNQRGLSRKHLLHSIEDSLRRLKLDYVDLYQIHRWDAETPVEETIRALDDIVRAGKARYVGGSSMYAWQFAKALFTADLHRCVRFVAMQNHYNLIYREEEREMIPLCREEGIAVNPWSPLARGFLMGNRTRDKGGETPRSRDDAFAHEMYYDEVDFAIADRVGEVAGRLGVGRAQVALAWMLQKPGITSPVVGPSKAAHVTDTVAALDVCLAAEEIAYLEEPYRPKRVLGM